MLKKTFISSGSILFGLLLAVPFYSAKAAKKVDLDDVKIKGELHGDNQLRLMARESNQLKNYVKFRTNYQKDIIEELPLPEPRVKY